jgi:hypothetical protein
MAARRNAALRNKTEGRKLGISAHPASDSAQLQRKPCRRLKLSRIFSMPCATATNWSKPSCMDATARPLKA